MGIEELRSAIMRYKHLLRGGELDYDATLRVEEAELALMRRVEEMGLLEELDNLELSQFMIRHEEALAELIREAARLLNLDIRDPREALEAFLTGNTRVRGFRAAFVAVQAVARLKARLYEEKHGAIDNASPVCPVCGAVSHTMVRRSGSYYMICPFCGYSWKVSDEHLVCPYCGNRDPMSLGIFTGKKVKRLGLAWCQRCGSTWRVVLDEKISAPRLLLVLISYGAEVYRSMLPAGLAEAPKLLGGEAGGAELEAGEEGSEEQGSK